MKKYLVTYWTERNDESTDVEIEIYAYNEIDAMKKFYDMNIVYRKIESVEEMFQFRFIISGRKTCRNVGLFSF